MSRFMQRITPLAIAVTAGSISAGAQTVRPVSVGLAFGSSIPTGALGNRVRNGYALDANGIYHIAGTPLGIRADIAYSGYGLTSSYIGQFQGANDGHATIASTTLDLTINMPRVLRLQPYLLGGGGVYRRHISVDRMVGAQFISVYDPYFGFYSDVIPDQTTIHASTQTKSGLNGGIGVLIPAAYINVFFEATYNSAFTSTGHTGFVPITIGFEW